MAAEAFYFLLDQKVTKHQVSRHLLLCRTGPWLQIRQNLGCKTLPYFVHSGHRFGKYYYALQPHLASIVLPDFGRSWSADGEMRNVCFSNGLNKDFLDSLLKFLSNSEKYPVEDDELKAIIEGAYAWDIEVSLIIYFFRSYLQKKANAGTLDTKEIESFYDLINCGNFRYQEFDREFIDYLFYYSRSKMKMNLEDILVTVQQHLSENNYESDLRY